jgi:hypothetical protein
MTQDLARIPERGASYYQQKIGNDEVYGSGSDGDVTIANGVTSQITRDMYYNNLTINSGGRLLTYGFRVFVKGTLTINGAIGSYGPDVASPGSATSGTLEQGRTTGNLTNAIGAATPGSTVSALTAKQLYDIQSILTGTVRSINTGWSSIFGGAYGSDGTNGITYTAPTDWPGRLGTHGNPGNAGTGANVAPANWPSKSGHANNGVAQGGHAVGGWTNTHTRPAHHGGGDHHHTPVPHTYTNHVAEAWDYDDYYQIRVYGGNSAPPTEYHGHGHYDAPGGSPGSHHYHINGHSHNNFHATNSHAYLYRGGNHHGHYDNTGTHGAYQTPVHKGNPNHTYYHHAHRVNRYHIGLIGGPTSHSWHYHFSWPGGHAPAGNDGAKGNDGNNGAGGPGGLPGNAGNAANNGAGGVKGVGGPGGPVVLVVAKTIIGSGTVDSYSYKGTSGTAATLATAGNPGTGAGAAPTNWPTRTGNAGHTNSGGNSPASNPGQYPPHANAAYPTAGGRAAPGVGGVAGPGGTAGNPGNTGNAGNVGAGGPINPTAPTAGTGGKAGGNGGILVVTDSIANTVTLRNSTYTPTSGDTSYNGGSGLQVVVINQ